MSRQLCATLVVALPTVTGRDEHLARCEAALHATVPKDVRLVIDVRKDRATCGEVWNEVAVEAQALAPAYLLCLADDLEPLPGWYEAAVHVVENLAATPSALIYTAKLGEPDAVESHGDWAARYDAPTAVSMSRIPFCRAEQWVPIPAIHYFSDNAFSSAMQMQGIQMVAVREYAFRHHWAMAGRHPMNDQQWNDEHAEWQRWAQSELLQRTPRWS
jgi:hypothetical protein